MSFVHPFHVDKPAWSKIIFIKHLSDNCFNVHVSYITSASTRKKILFPNCCGVLYIPNLFHVRIH